MTYQSNIIVYVLEKFQKNKLKWYASYQFVGDSSGIEFRGLDLYCKGKKVLSHESDNDWNQIYFLYPGYRTIEICSPTFRDKECLKLSKVPEPYKNYKKRNDVLITKKHLNELSKLTSLPYKGFSKT